MIGLVILALVVSLGMLAAFLGYAAAWFLWPGPMFLLTAICVALIVLGLMGMRRFRQHELARRWE